jgi:ABC-type uncharacterized transport system substrate-binding protein
VQIEIINVQQFPTTDTKRLGQFDSMVIYRAAGGRTNSVMIPKTPVTAKEIEAAIVEQQKTLAPLIGHKFDIK